MCATRIFISGTSRDMGSYRRVVTRWARDRGYEAVVQDDFPVQSDFGTVVQMLRDKMATCDAVVHLAGLYYGFEPSAKQFLQERTKGKRKPALSAEADAITLVSALGRLPTALEEAGADLNRDSAPLKVFGLRHSYE